MYIYEIPVYFEIRPLENTRYIHSKTTHKVVGHTLGLVQQHLLQHVTTGLDRAIHSVDATCS